MTRWAVVRPRLALRRLLGVLHVVVEEAAQGALDPLLLAARRRPQVDAVEHELAQAQHRAADLLALDDVAGLGVEWATMSRTRVSIRAEPVGPSSSISAARQVRGPQDAGAQGVVDVVVDVGDAVDQLHDPPLERRRLARAGVVEDAVADRLGQVEAGAVALEHVDDPQRVLVVLEAARRSARAAPASSASSPLWPKGGWPRSWPSPIASVRSSLRPSARATVRAIPQASSVWVSRVR